MPSMLNKVANPSSSSSVYLGLQTHRLPLPLESAQFYTTIKFEHPSHDLKS
jgi:hypothetical protein